MTQSKQLVFDLPRVAVDGREDFFVAPSNQTAMSRIENWARWSDNMLLLIGPEGSGKTHLASVWAQMSGATRIEPEEIEANVIADARAPVVIDDVDQIAGDRAQEENVFHLFNTLKASQIPVLFTATSPSSRWPLVLPDLASRMAQLDLVKLDAPDDQLLSVVIVKQFLDRQLNVKPEIVTFLARRMNRSFSNVSQIVDKLDQAALSSGRSITIPFLRKVLGDIG